MATPLPQEALDTLFMNARTYNNWQEKVISEDILKKLFDLTIMAPTSANCAPARFIFLQSQEAKEKLKPCLDPGNVDKTMSAPVTVIIAKDMDFYEEMPRLFPHTDAKAWFVGNDKLIKETAYRNSALQGAYLITAARALGLDCGPMSGFDKQAVKDTFFADKNWKANFLCNLGYGDAEGLYPRSPRFSFDDVCEVL